MISPPQIVCIHFAICMEPKLVVGHVEVTILHPYLLTLLQLHFWHGKINFYLNCFSFGVIQLRCFRGTIRCTEIVKLTKKKSFIELQFCPSCCSFNFLELLDRSFFIYFVTE